MQKLKIKKEEAKSMKINNYIEHTLLKPEATLSQIENLAKEAIDNDFLGICINPVHLKAAKTFLKNSNVKLVTVIGFPLGANNTAVKVFEAKQAIEDGADELDMVINVGALKAKDYEFVENDIKSVAKACDGKILKVILETDLLEKDEIIEASKICVKAGANFVKTSTGFVKNGVGAKVEDVKLMAETVTPFGLKVKASGGIKTKQSALALIEAGASRLGTSSGIQIVAD
jgi:deoxyribose-phosphate aldolase